MKALKILTLHFFNRFFQNETLPFKEATVAKAFSLLSILAVLSGAIAYWENLKYIVAPLLFPYVIGMKETSWKENFVFLSFSMVVMGLVSLIEWDEIFLKKEDYANLSALPVRKITVFLSKGLSLMAFVALFAVSISLFSSPIFGLGRAKAYGNSIGLFLKISFAHSVSVFASALFVFLFVMCTSGFLILFLGETKAERISVYFQGLAVALFLSFFGVFDKLYSAVSLSNINKFPFSALPPLWFSGLYEEIAGINPGIFHAHFFKGVVAISFLLSAFVLEYLLLYKRLKREKPAKPPSRPPGGMTFFLHKWFFKNPLERAIFQFIKTVMSRSRRHRLVFSFYIVGVIGLFSLKIARILYSGSLYSVFLFQFIHLFFLALVLGFRMVVGLPWFIEGNWIFKITEGKEKKDYITATKKSFFLLYLLPGFLAILIFYTLIWGVKLAFLESLYGLLSSLILLELAFIKYNKIPFSCATVPGKMNLHIFWFFYTLGIYIYTYILGVGGKLASEKGGLFLILYIFPLIFLLILKKISRIPSRFTYEENPEPVVMGLGLRDD